MKPTSCIEEKPTAQTVYFAGEYINLSAVARLAGIHRAYLSHIMVGRRDPTLKTCHKLALALGMTVYAFVEALDIHINSRTKAA